MWCKTTLVVMQQPFSASDAWNDHLINTRPITTCHAYHVRFSLWWRLPYEELLSSIGTCLASTLHF